MKNKKGLQEDCEEIIKTLLQKHHCLLTDVWDNDDAAEIVADLIILIRRSHEIEIAWQQEDWGK